MFRSTMRTAATATYSSSRDLRATLHSTASLEKLELHPKACFTYSPGGCDWCQVLPHGLDNSSSPNPQPYADANTTIKQKPYWCCYLCRHILSCINKIQSNQRTNGIAGRKESSGDFLGRNTSCQTQSAK